MTSSPPTITTVILNFAVESTPPFINGATATAAGFEVGLRLANKYPDIAERALASIADERNAIDPLVVDIDGATEQREAMVDVITSAFRVALGDEPMPDDDANDTDDDGSPVMIVITPISGDDEGMMFL